MIERDDVLALGQDGSRDTVGLVHRLPFLSISAMRSRTSNVTRSAGKRRGRREMDGSLARVVRLEQFAPGIHQGGTLDVEGAGTRALASGAERDERASPVAERRHAIRDGLDGVGRGGRDLPFGAPRGPSSGPSESLERNASISGDRSIGQRYAGGPAPRRTVSPRRAFEPLLTGPSHPDSGLASPVAIVGATLAALGGWLPGVLRVPQLPLGKLVQPRLLTLEQLELVGALVRVDLIGSGSGGVRRARSRGFRPVAEQAPDESHSRQSTAA